MRAAKYLDKLQGGGRQHPLQIVLLVLLLIAGIDQLQQPVPDWYSEAGWLMSAWLFIISAAVSLVAVFLPHRMVVTGLYLELAGLAGMTFDLAGVTAKTIDDAALWWELPNFWQEVALGAGFGWRAVQIIATLRAFGRISDGEA